MSLPSTTRSLASRGSGPGDRDSGEDEVRGECREVNAVVVAPGFDEVVMVRGFEGEVCVVMLVECVGCEEEEAFPCWIAECARKAARKFERKGRLVGIFAVFGVAFVYAVC